MQNKTHKDILRKRLKPIINWEKPNTIKDIEDLTNRIREVLFELYDKNINN